MTNLLKSCTAALACLSFATQVVAAEPLKALGKGEGAVSIVAWAGYIERGETDKTMTGSPISKRRPAARFPSRPPPPRMKWSR